MKLYMRIVMIVLHLLPVAEEWFNMLKAPRKQWLWFENSAHSPIKNEPRAWGTTVRDILRLEERVAPTNI